MIDRNWRPTGSSIPLCAKCKDLYRMSTVTLKGPSTWRLVLVWVILTIAGGILFLRIPTAVALAFRYDYSVIPILLTALYVAISYCPEKFRNVLFLNLVIWTCLLPLSGLWRSGLSDPLVVGGILPFSDAFGYYSDAVRLLSSGHVGYFAARRPLFPGMLASLLEFTGHDLRLTIIIIVGLTGVCLYLAIREVQRDYGYVAGLCMFLLLFLFYRRFIGTTMTENLGLALGSLAFVALWRSAGQASMGYGFLGLFLLTVALCARAGAFFVLPAIVIWGTWVFRGEKRFSGTFLLGGLGAVAAGFALDALLRQVISPIGPVGFGNFSYSLYGILAGGNWTLIYTQHPEILHLVEPELSHRVNALAFQMLREHPLWLLYGILRAWKTALWFPSPSESIFGFFINMNPRMYPYHLMHAYFSVFNILTMVNVLVLVAFLSFLRKNRDSLDLLMMAVAVGIFLSLPFARVVDSDNMRAYAATIPLIALFPVLGLHWLMGRMVREQNIAKVSSNTSWFPLALLASVIVALSVLGPLGFRIFAKGPPVLTTSCDNGRVARCIWFSPEASIDLTPDNYSNFISKDNVVAAKNFKKNLSLFEELYPDLAGDFQSLSSSTTITFAPCMESEDSYYFIFDKARVKIPAGPVMVCGEILNNRRLFRIEEVKQIE